MAPKKQRKIAPLLKGSYESKDFEIRENCGEGELRRLTLWRSAARENCDDGHCEGLWRGRAAARESCGERLERLAERSTAAEQGFGEYDLAEQGSFGGMKGKG
ncbi:hypothetical protein Droror1_Dr00024516 [Drosera rotundifolia]